MFGATVRTEAFASWSPGRSSGAESAVPAMPARGEIDNGPADWTATANDDVPPQEYNDDEDDKRENDDHLDLEGFPRALRTRNATAEEHDGSEAVAAASMRTTAANCQPAHDITDVSGRPR